ncbi:MAG: cysteate synthase [Spirochaetales bacterium]|nr:cysteate synthase [Spirochaetales bacterium]
MNTAVDLHYKLRCLETGEILSDVDAPLSNPNATQPAFLRTEYDTKQFAAGPLEDGIYRFERWMPVRRRLEGSSAPITYQSEGLARHLGLNRLFITFSGYWPERGCRMLTGTFKECEAYSVCARTPSDSDSVLVVASAGNTARAFARVCSDNEIPLVVVIPEGNLPSLWSIGPLSDCVRVIAAGRDSDYSDAIALAGTIASLPGFNPEGGAKNVARRDGMGTTVLSAADAIGEIPHHYFQAVGSGTGAIAAWEASLRLVESGQFGSRKMKIRVSQNAPFSPIHKSWQQRSRALLPFDEQEARRQIAAINAKVLANRKPPYSLIGGLYEALVDSDGTTGSIDNETASSAGELFLKTEGIDASPAAAVAVADLIQATKNGTIERDEIVMLNLTGGGVDLVAENEDVRLIPPTRIINSEESDAESVDRIMKELF